MFKIIPYLNILFNCSFETGVVPDKLKVSRVIPIYKNGSHLDMCNFRPISLLSIFDKILEKLMYNRFMQYLEKFKIF